MRHRSFRRPAPGFRRTTAIVVAVSAALLAAACSSSGTSGSAGSSSNNNTTLTVEASPTGPIADTFNPFLSTSPATLLGAGSMVYEPLMQYNLADANAAPIPWLATSYAFSNGDRTLTFQLRHGVTWSDGKPFTSADVVFTFDQAIHSTALNKFGLPLASVAANGPYAVTINFTQAAYTDAYYALGKVEILPQHIWASIKDPATFLNTNPVGTGAYELGSFSGQVFTMTANPHYYLPGLPKFKTIRFLAFSGNTTSDAAIESGEVDWAGSYIPGIQKLYLAKNKNFVVSDIPLSTAFLVPNMASGPTANLAVRQAISTALNRTDISDTVYNGYASPT